MNETSNVAVVIVGIKDEHVRNVEPESQKQKLNPLPSISKDVKLFNMEGYQMQLVVLSEKESFRKEVLEEAEKKVNQIQKEREIFDPLYLMSALADISGESGLHFKMIAKEYLIIESEFLIDYELMLVADSTEEQDVAAYLQRLAGKQSDDT